MPPVEAYGKKERNNPPAKQQTNTHRSGGGRTGKNEGVKPNNNKPATKSGNNTNRPGNNNKQPNNKPGNNTNRSGNNNKQPNNKPGNNTNRPGNNNKQPNNRPNSKPKSKSNPKPKPNNNRPSQHGRNKAPGNRPAPHNPPKSVHRPAPSHWSRPVPPPSWRPGPGCPVINSILGVTFGTAIAVSLDYLYNNNYNVSGYNNNTVYLSNVSEMSYNWPEATLYYGTNGLERSVFYYSTDYASTARYTNVYESLCNNYGSPVSDNSTNSKYSTTWFSSNKGYITLEYQGTYSSSGGLRYYTTLSIGA